MKRQEKIKEAAYEAKAKHIGYGDSVVYAFIDGALWADAHPAWISVEDELPKEHGRYLVVNGVTKEQEIFVYSNGIWWHNAYRCPIGVVTHWMPLPSIEHFADASKKTSSSSEIPTNLKGGEQ